MKRIYSKKFKAGRFLHVIMYTAVHEKDFAWTQMLLEALSSYERKFTWNFKTQVEDSHTTVALNLVNFRKLFFYTLQMSSIL